MLEDSLHLSITLAALLAEIPAPASSQQEAKLIPADLTMVNDFGNAVAMENDTALIGANHTSLFGVSTAGAAYVFVRSGATWSEQQKIIASDAGKDDLFGSSVAISGDTAVIGASGSENSTGSAYVFVRSGTTWIEQQKLTASDEEVLDVFGYSVAISGDTALIGAPSHPLVMNEAGSAYVFVRNGTTWSEHQKLIASDASATDEFGHSVALSAQTAVIGSWKDDNLGGADAGSAYVFARNGTTWSERQKLVASDARIGDQFGSSVSLSGDRIVVGSWLDDTSKVDIGSAYLFERSGLAWTQQSKFLASDGSASDHFGASVVVLGDTAVVGSVDDMQPGAYSPGSAYVFGFTPAPVTYCTAGTSASGCQALIFADGTASTSAPSGFALQASAVEGAQDGLFFWGTSGRQANPWGNGTSLHCVVPPVARAGLLPGVGTLGGCDGSFALDLNALWCPTCPKAHKNPGAGAVVQAQLWYADPFSTSNQTSSLSDAIEFSLQP